MMKPRKNITLNELGELLTKKCSKCKVFKPKIDYCLNNCDPLGIRSNCKACDVENRKDRYKSGASQNTWLKHAYGITLEEYNTILQDQNNTCSICNNTVPNMFTKNKDRLVVDHCHATGKVRSLLCSTCNVTVGKFESYYNEESIKNFFEYLQKCSKIKEEPNE